MPKRRKYSAEFKRQAVELAGSPGVSARQVAQELGINGTMLSRWCREAGAAGEKAFQGQGKARDEELANLKRELPGCGRSGIFCKKRRRSSRKCRSEVPDGGALPRDVSCAPEVPVPEGVCQWLVRLA